MPLAIEIDEPLARFGGKVVGNDTACGLDRRPHLRQVLGAVLARCQVGLEAAPLTPGECPFEVIGDELDSLLANEVVAAHEHHHILACAVSSA